MIVKINCKLILYNKYFYGVLNSTFHSALLESHKVSMTEVIQRDKNHPSIIMWSLANEPGNNINASVSYFQ